MALTKTTVAMAVSLPLGPVGSRSIDVNTSDTVTPTSDELQVAVSCLETKFVFDSSEVFFTIERFPFEWNYLFMIPGITTNRLHAID